MQAEWDNIRILDLPPSTDHSSYLGLQNSQLPNSFSKPPRPKQSTARAPNRNGKQNSRARSHRRRYQSNSCSRASRGNKQIVVKQQPGGWYQAQRVTRNLSLAPREPSYEPLLAFSFDGDTEGNKKRRRKKRKHPNRWQSLDRFPSPSVFKTTLGILRELPCSQMHYNAFKRIFPNLPTRTEKERRFRTEAAKEMPFAKYPDDQMRGVLERDSSTSQWSVSDRQKQKAPQAYPTAFHGDGLEGTQAGWTEKLAEMSKSQPQDEKQLPNEADDDDDGKLGDAENEAERPKRIDAEEQLLSSTASINGWVKRTNSDDFLSANDGSDEPEDSLAEPIERIRTPDTEQNSTCKSSPKILGDENHRNECTDTTALLSTDSILGQSSPQIEQVEKAVNDLQESRTQPPCAKNSPRKTLPPSLYKLPKIRPMATGGISCVACGQPAYPAERLEADGQVFHVNCFRCHQCATMLQRGSWNQRGRHHLCNPCHRRIALQTLRH